MKLSKLFFAGACAALVGGANAADITVYFSPTCPHCHHAREFIGTQLIYEYNDLKVSEVDVTKMDNRQDFVNALYKCGYHTGGVPVIVVGEKCFQGYGDATRAELRTAVEVDLSDEQKASAAENRTALDQDHDAFVAAHADRQNAIYNKDAVEKPADNAVTESGAETAEKKTDE